MKKGCDSMPTSALKKVGLALGPALMLLIILTGIPGLERDGAVAAAISVMVAVWWILAVMPPVIPALLACVLFLVLKVVPPADALAGFASPSIWMLLFALMIAKGVERSGLAKRIAVGLMSFMPLSFNGLVLVFMILCAIFPFFIPAVSASVALIMTLALGFMDALGIERSAKNRVSAGLTCFIGILAVTLSRVPVTGQLGNFVALGLVKEITGVDISYLDWIINMWVILPPVFIATYFYITRVYRPDAPLSPENLRAQVERTREAMGPVTFTEIKAMILVMSAIILWIADPWLHIGISQIGIIIGMLFLLPFTGTLTTEDFVGVSWDTFVFSGASYTMGVVLTKTGFAQWTASLLTKIPFLQGADFFTAGIFVIVFSLIIHFILETMGEISLLTPVILKTGLLSPEATAFLVSYGVGLYIFPYQSAALILSLAFGTTSWTDITRYGLMITLVGLAEALILLPFYWAYTLF